MDPEVFQRHFRLLGDAIDGNDPDPRRGDWIPTIRALESVEKSAQWLLDHLGETQEQFRAHVIDRSAALAALLYCGQRHREARALLERCAKLSVNEEVRALYSAGAENLDIHIKLARARWLFSRDRRPEAIELAAELRDAAEPIAKVARRIERAPVPVSSGPTSFTLNGFGTKLYFDSEHEDDGSVVRTRFVTALFIPVIPIDAWRVTDAADDRFFVHGKVPLSKPMRIWQYAAIGLLVAALGWAGIASWLDSPERKLRIELEAVAEYEADDPERALARYEQLALQYAVSIEDDEDLLAISEGWVEHATRAVPDPLTPDGANQLGAVIARWEAMPSRFRTPSLSEPFVAELVGGIDQLGNGTPEAADASLALALAADRVAPQDRRVDERIYATRVALAGQLAEDWPIEAILQYANLGIDERTSPAIGELLAKLPESPTLFADIGPEVIAWSNATPGGEWAVDRVRRGLELVDDPERLALFERRDPTELEAALAADPGDQGVAVVLAGLHRGRGELDEAVAILAALGKPGVLTHEAQVVLATLEFDRGNLDEAASLLEKLLRNRLPAFDEARRAYDRELERLQEQLIARAEQGKAPPKYQADLGNQDAEIASAAFRAWMFDEFEKSPTLPGLRDAYTRRSDIVPVAILLGTVRLEQARSATGDERRRLLDAAEQTFLSFRSEAQGVPDYHASLAQVYHRLGKPAEGDAEFQILLDDPDPSVHLVAAKGYRELGRFERAREISETLYEKTQPPLSHHAAHFRAVLAFDLEERELWLGRADANDPFVRSNLLEAKGDRLRLAGEFEDADAQFEEAYELALAQVEHGASPNNAALLLLSRHGCTGDLEHVDDAVGLLEKAVAQAPDDAIVLLNYASVLDFRTTLALIDRVVPVEGLRISQAEAQTVFDALLHSSKRDELLAAMRESPERQRVLDTLGRLETLAPSMDVVYDDQWRWLERAQNDAGLAKLLERVRAVDNLDTSDQARLYADHLEGRSDEILLQRLEANLSARAAIRTRAKRATAPVQAVLAYLDGEDLLLRAVLREQPSEWLADIHAAVEAHERAIALWPEGFSERDLAYARIVAALLELAAEDEAMAAVWREHGRENSTAIVLVLLEGHPALVAKLSTMPGFQQGVRTMEQRSDDELSAHTYVLARVAGNEALQRRSAASSRSERSRVLMQLEELLRPHDTSNVRAREYVEAEIAKTE
jgi:tetratricopeptide (TPR) repeat protein